MSDVEMWKYMYNYIYIYIYTPIYIYIYTHTLICMFCMHYVQPTNSVKQSSS